MEPTPPPQSQSRCIRVFISSTFRDMMEERDELMAHTWPELRRFCLERHVELVEVDLRWGIAEEQSTRKETLKLCLDEIRACRPFFIGLLGERYGWTPGDDAFTDDLKEEQPWLKDLHGKSVTELEILHGMLNNPDMAGRAFFYFRDPAYSASRGPDFQSENTDSALKQAALKTLIKRTCTTKQIPLFENYRDPVKLASLVIEDLKTAIEAQFPKENVPDALTREAQDHEAFAEIRRRTYIGRAGYYDALDRNAASDDVPLLVVGESGCGKSALLANWVERWRKDHPKDFILQHYIGGTAASASHWRLMSRVMAEIKRWTGDPEAVPTKPEDILRDFPLWLTKARARALHEGVRCILVLDALNQLDEQDHARLLGWLPEHPFCGPLRLIVSTLPGKIGSDDPLAVLQKRHWQETRVLPLTMEERSRMITGYLARFGKQLDAHRLDRLAKAPAAANPLFLKILLDDLRVTGTHDRLDQRLTEYLTAADIPTLLQQVLARYQHDYERDRPGLVGESLGLIWAARRGLTETELLHLLRPKSETRNPQSDRAQLPPALWTPLRAALEDTLIDRGGILNFAHDFLRMAVETAFVPDQNKRHELQLQLADDFEAQPITTRTCDELPWLLLETESFVRLRSCLLNIDRFLLVRNRDEEELRRYWIGLGEERTIGEDYLASFEAWSQIPGRVGRDISYGANQLAYFLSRAALYAQAEPLMRRALLIDEAEYGLAHTSVAAALLNLAQLLAETNRPEEAEPLLRRALAIYDASIEEYAPQVSTTLNNLAQLLEATNRHEEAELMMRRALKNMEATCGELHPNVAGGLNNLAALLQNSSRFEEAEPLYRRALAIAETSLGDQYPSIASILSNLAGLLKAANQLDEAERLYRRALAITQTSLGDKHPNYGSILSNVAHLLQDANRLDEAEPLMQRVVEIFQQSLGASHPKLATALNNLAMLFYFTGRLTEAEPLMRRALVIQEVSFGRDHPELARDLGNLAQVLMETNRLEEAEPLMRRALAIREFSFGGDHPELFSNLCSLAQLLYEAHRMEEAEPVMRRGVEILLNFSRASGRLHPLLENAMGNYYVLLEKLGCDETHIRTTLRDLASRYGIAYGGPSETTGSGPSPKLRDAIEELIRDPSRASEIAVRLQRQDPVLFMEFFEWLQSQQGLTGKAPVTSLPPGGGPSPRLIAVMEELSAHPSRFQEIAARLRSEDPALFLEFVEWVKRQQT